MEINQDQLYNLELELEGQGMIGAGAARFNRNLKKNLERGRQSVTPAYVYLQKELIELSKLLGVKSKVHWLGKTEYINEFLSKIDLFILPSKYEGFGLVLLEAMVAKTPIIAANNSAIPEVLGKTYEGLFLTGDIKALAQQIKTVISNNIFSERLVQSYSSQLELFDPSKMNKNIENAYSNAGF